MAPERRLALLEEKMSREYSVGFDDPPAPATGTEGT